MTAIPQSGRLRQENREFEDSTGYRVICYLKGQTDKISSGGDTEQTADQTAELNGVWQGFEPELKSPSFPKSGLTRRRLESSGDLNLGTEASYGE